MSNFPLVIDKSRTNKVAGGGLKKSDSFAFDVKKQGLADIQNWIINTTRETVIAQKDKHDNEPTTFTVDNSRFKPLTGATKRVEVLFGTQALTRNVMVETERSLRSQIKKRQLIFTGALEEVNVNWVWFYADRQSGYHQVSSFKNIKLKKGSALILAATVPQAFWQSQMTDYLGAAVKQLNRKQTFKRKLRVKFGFRQIPELSAKNDRGLTPCIIIEVR